MRSSFAPKIMNDASTYFRVGREGIPLPDPAAFDAEQAANLDARWAWKEFGGRTLDEADEHFCSNPCAYSEAFLFMGFGAFRYYFPVIDRYVRSVSSDDCADDCDLAIVGATVSSQIAYGCDSRGDAFLEEVEETARHVLHSIPSYGMDSADEDHVRWEWEQVCAEATSIRERATHRSANPTGEQDAPSNGG